MCRNTDKEGTTREGCQRSGIFICQCLYDVFLYMQVISGEHSVLLVAHVFLEERIIRTSVYAELTDCQGIINPCSQWETNFIFHSPIVATLSHVFSEFLPIGKKLVNYLKLETNQRKYQRTDQVSL